MSEQLHWMDVDAALQNKESIAVTITSSMSTEEEVCVGFRQFFPKHHLNLGNCVLYLGTVLGAKNDRPWALTFFPEGDHHFVKLG